MPEPFVLLQILIAAVAAPTAFILWFALVRPVPERAGSAAIMGKTLLDAHTITRYPSNVLRQSWTPTTIRINEAYVFDLDLDDVGKAVFALDTIGSKAFEVGQRVVVRYEVRGLGALWKMIRVKGMEAAV
jgi:hypothetical protein